MINKIGHKKNTPDFLFFVLCRCSVKLPKTVLMINIRAIIKLMGFNSKVIVISNNAYLKYRLTKKFSISLY